MTKPEYEALAQHMYENVVGLHCDRTWPEIQEGWPGLTARYYDFAKAALDWLDNHRQNQPSQPTAKAEHSQI